MAQTLGNNPNTFDIPLSLVVADRKKNSRSVMNEDTLDDLKETIKREGQLTPVKAEKRDDGKFDLVFGYRRHAAIVMLREEALGKKKDSDEWMTIRCEVVDKMDEQQRKIQNIAENMAREDLTTYDQGVAFYDLKKEHEMSGGKIASNIGKSSGYVNNLIRVMESLDESVLKRWEKECNPKFGLDGDGKKIPTARKVCTMDFLLGLCNTPKAEQDYAVRVALGLEQPDEDEGDDDEGDEGSREPNANKRASMSNLTKALKAAEEKLSNAKDSPDNVTSGTADENIVNEMKIVIAVLKYSMGKVQSIKGVYKNPAVD